MNTNQQSLTVTPLSELLEASKGNLVQLPPFAEGTPFVARLKRPSILALVKSGKIPNSLLSTANKLFTQGTVDSKDDQSLSNLFQVLDVLCGACFVEPRYEEIKQAGIELTDDQYMFIFNYTQTGVNALRDFRVQPGNTEPDTDELNVQQDSQ